MASIKTKAVETEVVDGGFVPNESSEKKKIRGEICTILGKEHFVKAPKAKDMISLEKQFQNSDSTFAQGLLLVAHLCETVTYEELEDLYVEDLIEVFEVFEKLMKVKSDISPA